MLCFHDIAIRFVCPIHIHTGTGTGTENEKYVRHVVCPQFIPILIALWMLLPSHAAVTATQIFFVSFLRSFYLGIIISISPHKKL